MKPDLKRFLFNIWKTLAVIIVPLLILSLTLSVLINCRWLYEQGFEKYEVSQQTGFTPAQLKTAASALIGYFNNSEEYLNLHLEKDGADIQVFNEREMLHLKDVKGLIRLNYLILGICLVLGGGFFLYLYFKRQHEFKKEGGMVLLQGGIFSLMLLGGIGLIALLDFQSFFTRLHLLGFSNDFWLLDPTKDYLIMFFPKGFWADSAVMLGISIGVLASGTTICGRLLGKSSPSNQPV
ncbi:TIGR01906 family membrane protein [Dehalococcoides mccartyi]|uniref:TIGR01906 family membrane protein n=1 Tax=Dehalococcoides mccartyi TaxID=61435 RepID=UPI0003C87551|nr:TIGR01906 family membrane protein [Dehalococcoides mccartyi]AHB14066.1 putative membrane protein [Dehalococcoides mccartyi GY50]